MQLDDEDIRPRYRLCRTGFSLIALSLALLCVAKISILAIIFGNRREVLALYNHELWFWLIDAPITWGALIGSYMLWGRWADPSWQRRAGLLLLMNAMDAGMWVVAHSDRFGLEISGLDLDWTMYLVSSGLGWFELMLAASMAADISAHLGQRDAPESSQAASALALIGIAMWGMLALIETDWGTWPLARRRFPNVQLLVLLSTALGIILTFQVTVLSLTASRHCGSFLRGLNRRERDEDLLISRSETESDDIFWKD